MCARRIIFTCSPMVLALGTVIRGRMEGKPQRNTGCRGATVRVESAQIWCRRIAMIDRRGFLSSFGGAAGVATTLGLRGDLFAQLAQAPAHLPDPSLYDSNEEAYFTENRKHCLTTTDVVYLSI